MTSKQRPTFLTLSIMAVMALLSTVVVLSSTSATVAAQSDDGIMLRAQLKDDGNRPMPEITVIATLAPSEFELARSVEGSELNRYWVGQSTTTEGGAFSFHQDPGAIPDQYVEADGSINVGLTFARPDEASSSEAEWLGGYSVTLYPPRDGKGPWRASDASEETDHPKNARSMALKFTLGDSGRITPDESTEGQLEVEAALAETPQPNNASGEDGVLRQNQTTSCSEAWQANYYNVPIIMMSAGSNSSVVQYDYEFEASDSQKMGVAYSGTGVWGSFSVGGTKTTSSSVTINWPARTAASGSDHIYYRSQAKYSKYKETCYFSFWGSWFTTTSYEVRPRYIEGDQLWSGQANTYPTHCSSMLPGGSLTKSWGTSISYSNGVDISSNIGIDLKLQNDMTGGSSHKITFTNISPSDTKWVCGQYAEIGGSYTGTLMGDYWDR